MSVTIGMNALLDDLVPVSEVAQLLRTSARHVRRLGEDGRLEVFRLRERGETYVTKSSLRQYLHQVNGLDK